MPAISSDGSIPNTSTSAASSADHLPRKSQEKTLTGLYTVTNGTGPERGLPDHKPDPFKVLNGLKNSSLNSLPNGTPTGGMHNGRERSHSKAGSVHSIGSARGRFPEAGRLSSQEERQQKTPVHELLPNGQINGVVREPIKTPGKQKQIADGEYFPPMDARSSEEKRAIRSSGDGHPIAPTSTTYQPLNNRFSSPPATTSSTSQGPTSAPFPRLAHRHTLQIPKVSTNVSRGSRDFSFNVGQSEETISAVVPTGRMSPLAPDPPRNRRASLGLVRRTTRPDAPLDDYPPDEDAVRWTEAIRQKRASRRKRKEEEDDDRVIVGTKVDQGHVNWVTAYNMLTGIRFTVSRTNAKMDRDLTDADFTAQHKFSFDITGNELTPSAKYDFKFKDYSPWVFRHLRSVFGLDPADYLMSLTSKYILSELGSPGKSGSFFYFSRDYKYIIKTIHHAEHKLLRRVLKEYYNHVMDNPNTLISQFYGLHRVKIPYGRKIHFVVMNNLFPPHRDVHQMFDLKGSTIGRDFREEDLAKNPRATLKDLNWLRRGLHLELGPGKREAFIEQMKRDVSLLQRLHIMDYSMLVGIHDLEKGNEQNLRENMLKVFQPGGERTEGYAMNMLTRTPSRLENAKKARELRLTLKKEKPVPMGMVQAKMPDEMLDERKDRFFYSDDGGFQATHDNGEPGEVIYYLGIIDCLTHVSAAYHLIWCNKLNSILVWLRQAPRALLERPLRPKDTNLPHSPGRLRRALHQLHHRRHHDRRRS
jgi:1-phosphatidylinositol-4-phosphate 5-kinase